MEDGACAPLDTGGNGGGGGGGGAWQEQKEMRESGKIANYGLRDDYYAGYRHAK